MYFFANILFRLSKLPEKTKETKAVIIALALVLLNSIFVGHTINNAIAAPAITSLLSISTTILKERSKKNEFKLAGQMS